MPLKVWRAPATREHRRLTQVDANQFEAVEQRPHHWGQMFDQCWWRVQLPEPGDGRVPRYLRWLDQGEATVVIDGQPHYGIDPGHGYAPLPQGCEQLHIESLCARTGVWVTGEPQGLDPAKGSQFDGAFLATRDDEAWHALHDLDVLIGVVALLSKPEYPPGYDMWERGGYRPELTLADPLLRRLINRMNQAVDELDTSGLAACRSVLRQVYTEFAASPNELSVVLTGHAHIDLVWLWPERAGEFKAVHTFANALRMLEQYPEVTFGYSQPASYEAVGRRNAGLLDRVQEQMEAGRWEATGAMYVESDVQLPCGEGLVRAFELGQAGFRELTGRDSRCVWLPDVFGYSACLPTIMAGFDVPYFYTTKMHWSGATRFPHSSFRWVGMDGSVALSHISWHHYNQEVTPEELHNCRMQHRQSAVHDEALFPCGYGDGGGGLNESMCERARRLADLASMPRTRWGKIEDFFDHMTERADQLPRWRGEMYLEYHRGVQTTMGNLKAAFRAAERGLQAWEAVRCATGGGPIDAAHWKRLCFAQFHDAIPGSSIGEVYDQLVPELEALADRAMERACHELEASAAGPDETDGSVQECVFNPLSMPRQTMLDGKLVQLPPLAGVAVSSLTPIDAGPLEARKDRLSNGRVEAAFNDAGDITSLAVDGDAIDWAAPGGQLWTFPDVPASFDAWDIDRYTLSNGTHHTAPAEAQVDRTDAGACVSFRRDLSDLGVITLRYKLEPGDAVLRIDAELDLHQPQTLVKLAFPTTYQGREARYGAPFGSVKRPQWAGPLTNDAMFENPASRWATICDDDERQGLMLISESKYGFGAHEGTLHVSLARSAQVTPANIVGDTTSLGSIDKSQRFADLGEQTIRLAVGRYRAGAPRPEQPAAMAECLFAPILRYRGRPINAGLRSMEGPPSLIPAWAKPHDDGSWTLRLHETLGGRGPYKLHLVDGLSITPTDLRGHQLPDPLIPLRASPYTLQSLRIGS